MTTREAFEKMIHTRGIHHALNSYSGYVTRLRTDLKKGRVSLDKMEELLELAGWKKVVVEQWDCSVKTTKSLSDKALDRLLK